MKRKISIRIDLKDDEAEKFMRIKEYFGLRSNSEVVRLMITEVYKLIISRKI